MANDEVKVPEQGITGEELWELATVPEREVLLRLEVLCPSVVITNRNRLQVAREFACAYPTPSLEVAAKQIAERLDKGTSSPLRQKERIRDWPLEGERLEAVIRIIHSTLVDCGFKDNADSA